jgi:hypothetical protein
MNDESLSISSHALRNVAAASARIVISSAGSGLGKLGKRFLLSATKLFQESSATLNPAVEGCGDSNNFRADWASPACTTQLRIS